MSAGSGKRVIFAWSGAKQHFFDIFSVIWQVQTYRRLCYLFMAVPLGLIYSIGLVIGLLFPITLIYLAAIRSGPLSPLFFSTLLIGFLAWRLIPVFVKIAIRLERFLAKELIGLFSISLTIPRSEGAGFHQSHLLRPRQHSAWKELFYLSFRIPMGFANLILIIISLLIPVLMLLAPWLYEKSGPDIVFSSAAIDTSSKAILLMLLAVPMFIVVLRGLRTLAFIQGRFAIFMLTDDYI